MYGYYHDHSGPEHHGSSGCNGHVFGYVDLLCYKRYAYGCFYHFRGYFCLDGTQWLRSDWRDGYCYCGGNLYADGDQSDLGMYGDGQCDGDGFYYSAGRSGDRYIQQCDAADV